MRHAAIRTLLWTMALAAVVVGVWAVGAPRSFYDDFLFGRGWVSSDGPYNEHLIRDVGALQLALAVVATAAAVRPSASRAALAAVATLAYAVPHLAYHTNAAGDAGAVDVAAQLVPLAAQVAAPLLVLTLVVPGGRSTGDRRAGPTGADSGGVSAPAGGT